MLSASWFARHPVEVAFDLIGCWLVVARGRHTLRVRIVETEAYGGLEDAASHSTMYRVGREVLISEVAHLYMYRAYGLHIMTNVVAHQPGRSGAVLLRAADDPVDGLDIVESHFPAKRDRFLQGPGNLSKGLGMMLSDTLTPVTLGNAIWFEQGERPQTIVATPRIGISRAVDAHWRFLDPASRCVSRSRRGEQVKAADLDSIVEQL